MLRYYIPAETLKQFCELYFPILTRITNKSMIEGTFQSGLKITEQNQVF